ncbi:MAG TPA: hypothetical protein VHN14_08040 [Kofleriaceae bacterium]|nr:hypothetical protein [Kofleriaceae bacterium]
MVVALVVVIAVVAVMLVIVGAGRRGSPITGVTSSARSGGERGAVSYEERMLVAGDHLESSAVGSPRAVHAMAGRKPQQLGAVLQPTASLWSTWMS